MRATLFFALLFAAACGEHPRAAGGAALALKELSIVPAAGALPEDDPLAKDWERAPVVVVPLLLQDVAEPRLEDKGAETLRLQALHDGARVAFRLGWEDPTIDTHATDVRSSDAVAIQLPATGGGGAVPDSMMGEAGKPVAISLWRHARQSRVEGEAFGIEALYPNAAVDHYPFEAASDPRKRAELEKLYDTPTAAGNPLAGAVVSAVEDLRAEGFGTLSHAAEQRSTGKGVHRDGRWQVVISRPLDVAPDSPTTLRPGESTWIAVAVWDGAHNHSGSRKMRSIWVPVRFEEAAP